MKGDFAVFWLPLAIFFALCAIEAVLVLRINDSHMIYTLDDPYIHLAMAENIARGHYGVNMDEFSAPSSSILWPFLLAPFARSGIDHLVPLFLNLIFAAGTLFLFSRIVICVFPLSETRISSFLRAALVVGLTLGTNVIGLVFIGMEHSLQLLLAASILYGLIREVQLGVVPRWLPVAIVLAPLVRFENLALSLPALAYLLVRRHILATVVSGSILLLALGSFLWFLQSMGLGSVPSSVIAKSYVVAAGAKWRALAGNVIASLIIRQGAFLGVAWLLLLNALFQPRKWTERFFTGTVLFAVSLHFMMGRFDWYNRYEIYMWGTSLLALLYVYRHSLRRLAAAKGTHWGVVALALVLGVVSSPYLYGLHTLPAASNNIYLQQFQMHRFITEYYRAPVAVNDLGLVSYRNDHYVLDLWGLASRQALDLRRTETKVDWMRDMTTLHDVKLAMVYRTRFPEVPSEWRMVGNLVAGIKVVTFYALDSETHTRASNLLLEFKETVPRDTRIELAGENEG